jgi:hypothetical protein
MKKRKVSLSQNSSLINSGSGYNKKEKASIRAKERFNKIAMTKARKYLILGLCSFVLVQIIKYIANDIIWANVETPTGILFLFITYLQIGLLVFTFIFLVAAAYQALKRIFAEIG